MRADKAALRSVLRQQPAAGDDGAICQRILAHPWFSEARTVMAYAAIPPEPDLRPVLEEILRQGKTLLLPRCGAQGTMTACRITDLGQLRSGAYGILEPDPAAEEFPPKNIDLILTPGLAFAPNGVRLGRGKGYYDRFLPRTRAKTIGICCETRLLQWVPTEPLDRLVDAVITEKRTTICRMEDGACLARKNGRDKL